MEQLLEVASQFPTVIYTTLLGIIVVYWLVGMVGLIELNFSGDVDIDIDVDADISIVGLTGFMLTFGLTGIPFTLVISIILLICWLISIYSQIYLFSLLPDGWLYYLLGGVSAIAIFFISLPIAAFIIRPLKGMFKSVETTTSNNLVGRDATIATGKVTTTFGQARVFNDGAEILLDVRCDNEHTLILGDKVLLIKYLEESHAYIVSPFPKNYI